MKLQYIFIALVIILVPFLILWLRITNVQQNNQETNQVTQTNTNNGNVGYEYLPPEAREAEFSEKQVLLVLSRGKISSYDAAGKVVKIQAENRTGAGIEYREETISLAELNEVKCWPQTMPAGPGQEVDITKAYIPLEPDKDLFLKNETTKTFSEVTSDLKPNTYVFIKKSVKSNNPSSTAIQLAVVGC